MAVNKIINIQVNDSDLDKLDADLKKVDKSIDKVDGSSKKASKSLQDVGDNGGAIAILDSLTGGLATRVRDAFEATKLFNFSLKGTKTALIATGVGAFVVALGLIVAYWDEIVEFITGANERLQEQINLKNEIIKDLDYELKLLDLKEKVLEKEGKSTEEIKKAKEAIILLQQEENLLLLDKLKTQFEIEKKQVNEISFWEKVKVGILGAAGAYDLAGQAAADAVIGDEEERNRLNEIEDQIQEATLRREQLKLDLLNLNTSETGDGKRGKESAVEGITGESRQAEAERKAKEFEELFEVEKMQQDALAELGREGLDAITNDENIANAVRTKNDEEWAKARERIAQEEANAKRTAFLGYADALSTISGVLGQQTVEGKALAVASSLVNTYASITGQLKAFSGVPVPGYAIAQAVATGLVGFANVKKILDVKVPNTKGSGGGGIGGGAGGGGGVGAQAPSFNVVGNSGVSQLAQTLGEGQDPIQAYVVAGDVSSAQEVNRNIVSNATLG